MHSAQITLSMSDLNTHRHTDKHTLGTRASVSTSGLSVELIIIESG